LISFMYYILFIMMIILKILIIKWKNKGKSIIREK
jgi:hypothetical protein